MRSSDSGKEKDTLQTCVHCQRSVGSAEAVLSPSLERYHLDCLSEAREALKSRVSLVCTFCHDALPRPEAVFCTACLAPHHEDCFERHGRCCTPGCGETHSLLVAYAKELSTMRGSATGDGEEQEVGVLNLLQMIVSTVDYQFA